MRSSPASLSQVLLFCAHVKSSAFNPISAEITFSLHSDNLLIHYLAGNFCIVIKDTGQLVIGYFPPLLDGREVPLWACRQVKFKSRSPANVVSITGRQVSGAEWQVELRPSTHLEEILWEFGCSRQYANNTIGTPKALSALTSPPLLSAKAFPWGLCQTLFLHCVVSACLFFLRQLRG